MHARENQAEGRPAGIAPTMESITIFEYTSQTRSSKNRITLHQNLFSFLLEGEKSVCYAGASAHIKPGQFLLLSAGNCLMSEKMVGKSGTYKSVLMAFDNQLLADFFVRHSGLLPRSPDRGLEEPFLRFEQDRFLTTYLESLRQLLLQDGSIAPAMRQIKLEELLLYLHQRYGPYLQTLYIRSQEVNQELLIRQAVTGSLDYPVTVEELAFLCHTSLSTFKRRFAKLYGNSPTKWLLEQRMQNAARLLGQEKLKASEIYDQLGYENLSSFIQSFKQVYGLTPKQYQVANLPGTDSSS